MTNLLRWLVLPLVLTLAATARADPPDTARLSPGPRLVLAPPAALVEPLRARDVALGLTVAAQVMPIVHRLTTPKDAPRVGHGTIRVVVEDDGRVSSVTSSSASWERLAAAMRVALGARPLAMLDGRGGRVLAFSVDAEVTRLPLALAPQPPPVVIDGCPSTMIRCRTELRGPVPEIDPFLSPEHLLMLLPLPRRVVTIGPMREEPNGERGQ